MSTNKKSLPLVEAIIEAKGKTEAIKVLNDVLIALNVSSSYLELVSLKDKLSDYQNEFRNISDLYRELAIPMNYEDVHEIRTNLNFLYRDISDALSFDINRHYIFYREAKTTTRAKASVDLKNDEEFKKNFKTTSESLIREYVGYSNTYSDWVSCAGLSYGLYKGLESLLSAIRQMVDSLASSEKHTLMILSKNVK